LRNRGLSVTLKLQPIQINGVPGEIRQVLSNLIMNSADASKPGGEIRIRVKQNAFFRNGSREDGVSVLVADSGQGMTREVLKKIFEPFFTTKKDVGTGLGLWISKEIVDRHRGWLRVRSRIAQGTVVRMVLPLASS
jgi:signal transduction histidine kinase